MIDASNGCNDDKAQSRLLGSEPLPLINNDTITGSVRERKNRFLTKMMTVVAPLHLDMMMLMLLGLISHQLIGLAIIGLYWF